MTIKENFVNAVLYNNLHNITSIQSIDIFLIHKETFIINPFIDIGMQYEHNILLFFGKIIFVLTLITVIMFILNWIARILDFKNGFRKVYIEIKYKNEIKKINPFKYVFDISSHLIKIFIGVIFWFLYC